MRRIVLASLVCATVVMLVPRQAAAQGVKKGDRNRITAADLAEAPVTAVTALDLMTAMRPNWLTPSRGRMTSASLEGGTGGGATEVVVYIDDMRQQGINDLRTVKATNVVEMRYLEQNRAVQLRGPGHEMGVIEVTTKDKRQ